MTEPRHYLLRMVIFLVIVLALLGLLWQPLLSAFLNNPVLNGIILFVLAIGIAWNLGQVTRLRPEVAWVETFQRSRQSLGQAAAPKLLAPMASMLASRDGIRDDTRRFTLSAGAMRSLLDGIDSRLDESRELSRYMTGLLIFLGLLGTFWGLLKTVGAVSDVIGSMSVGSGDVNLMFEQLKSGLVKPIAGMGTAFSASMFGLAGALVLGFLDLTAGQAQNRFFNELEEWLAGLTRLSSGALADGDGGSVPAYVQALLEQTAENMEQLQRVLTRGEDRAQQTGQAIAALAERMGALTDTLRASQQLMLRIGEGQAALAPALQRLTDPRLIAGHEAGDEIARAHLRNIELALTRLLAETEQGRTQATAELRSDLRILTRTVANLSPGAEPKR